MTEQDRPNLSLGRLPGSLPERLNPIPRAWLVLIALLHVAVLICLAVLMLRGPAAAVVSSAGVPLVADPSDLKAIAMALEEKSLDAEAARAWRRYLEQEGARGEPSDQRPAILYRVGKLYIDSGNYSEAAAALVEAQLAAEQDQKLKAEIGAKLIECLRRMGMYGEIGRELSRQVEAGTHEPGKPKVLVRLAGEEITEADLDRMIERRVDSMLSIQGAAADAAARQAVLEQLSSPQARNQMLQEILQTELFCRRARELKLDQQDEFLTARREMIDSLLAGRFLTEELKRIAPTDVDLRSYYSAEKTRYQEPESLQAVLVQLAEDEEAAEVLAGVESADDFEKLAAERTADGATPDRQIVRGRNDPMLGGTDALFELAEGRWTARPHVNQNDRYVVLVRKKTPARTPPYEEVSRRVAADYVSRKRQETTQKLVTDLMTRYDVQIVPPGGRNAEPVNDGPKPTEEQSP